jgi:DNA-binding transcriptional regulator YiaG
MPTGPELRHIKLLIEKRDRARAKERACSDELALEVWQVRQRGVSARNLAKALGVGASTVNDWTQAGKQIAAEHGEG